MLICGRLGCDWADIKPWFPVPVLEQSGFLCSVRMLSSFSYVSFVQISSIEGPPPSLEGGGVLLKKKGGGVGEGGGVLFHMAGGAGGGFSLQMFSWGGGAWR